MRAKTSFLCVFVAAVVITTANCDPDTKTEPGKTADGRRKYEKDLRKFLFPDDTGICPPIMGGRHSFSVLSPTSPKAGGCYSTWPLNNQGNFLGFDFWIGENGSCANTNETHMEHFEYHCNSKWTEGHPNGRQSFSYVEMQKRREKTENGMIILQTRCWCWEEKPRKKSTNEFGPSMVRVAVSDSGHCRHLPWFLNSPVPREKKIPNKSWDKEMHVLSFPGIFKGKEQRQTRDVGTQVDKSDSRKSRSSDDCRFPSWTQGMWTDLNVDSNVLSYARVTEMQNNGNVNEAEDEEYKVTHVRKRSVSAPDECASAMEIKQMMSFLKTLLYFHSSKTEKSRPIYLDGRPSWLDRINRDAPPDCVLTSEVAEMTKLLRTLIVSGFNSYKNRTSSLDKIEKTSDLDLDSIPIIFGGLTPFFSIFKNMSTDNSSKISKSIPIIDKYEVNDKLKLYPRRKRDTSDRNSNTPHVRSRFSTISIKNNVPIPNLPLQALREANKQNIFSTQRPRTEKPTTEEPAAKIPITERLTTDKPTTEKPTTEKPTTETLTTETLITDKPTTEKPTTEKPTTKKPTVGKPYHLKFDYPMDTADRYNRYMNPWDTSKGFDRDDDYVVPDVSRAQRKSEDYGKMVSYANQLFKIAEQNPIGRYRRDIGNKSKPNEHILKNYQWRCVMRVDGITTDTEKYIVFGGETTEGRVEDDEQSSPGIGLSDEKISDVTEMTNSTYGCLLLKNRGKNVLEYYITAAETKDMAINLCKQPEESIQNISWVTVARKSETERVPIQCPVPVGMVFTGFIPTPPEYATGTPRLCATLISKADECTRNDPDALARMRFTISECVTVAGSPPNPEPNEDNEYQCLGMWSEIHVDDVTKRPVLYTYLYTKRMNPRVEGVEEFDCFVGTTTTDETSVNGTAMMMTTAGSGTTCGRDADPIKDGMKLVGKLAGNNARECPPGQRQNGNRQTSRSSKLPASPILIIVAIILRVVGIY